MIRSLTTARPGAPGDAEPGARTLRACMFTAESQKGHARYTRDLMTALAGAGPARGVEVSLVTSRDLAEPYRSSRYPIEAILPPLVDRRRFKNRLSWGVSRLAHYVGRERAFLRWVASQPDLGYPYDSLLRTQPQW